MAKPAHIPKVTIKMPKTLLDKWLKALRSGEYKQGRGTLYCKKSDSYCCLGVLQAVQGKVEEQLTPTLDWLRAQGVAFWAGGRGVGITTWNARDPHLCVRDGQYRSAGGCNDDLHYDFNKIADLIEARAVGY